MYCTKCGKFVEREDALFCPFCGSPLNRETTGQDSFTQTNPETHTQQDAFTQDSYKQDHSYTNNTYQSGQNYQGYPNYQRRYDPYDAPSIGWAFLSFIVPIVGLVLYLIWKDESPLKAKSCLKGFIASIVFEVIVFCCFCGAFSSASSDYYYYYTMVSLLEGIL